jgi:chromosome segregation ATPase
MNEDLKNIESAYNSFKKLDGELDTFLMSIREVKEMRDTVGTLPEKLKLNEIEIENQKKELEQLIMSSNDLLIAFKEKSSGAIFDLGKKTDTLASEVRSGMSKFSNMFQQSNNQLQDQYRQKFEDISVKFEVLQAFCESLKNMAFSISQSVTALQDNYWAVSNIFDKLETSLTETKKNISFLQKRPYEYQNNMKEMEMRLEDLINKKYLRQKNFTWAILIMLVLSVVFLLSYLA